MKVFIIRGRNQNKEKRQLIVNQEHAKENFKAKKSVNFLRNIGEDDPAGGGTSIEKKLAMVTNNW